MSKHKDEVYRNVFSSGSDKTISALIDADCKLYIRDIEIFRIELERYKNTTGKVSNILLDSILETENKIRILTFVKNNLWTVR